MADTDIDPHIERIIAAFNRQESGAEFADSGTFVDPLLKEIAWAEFREYTVDVFEVFLDVRIEANRVMRNTEGDTTIECRTRVEQILIASPKR